MKSMSELEYHYDIKMRIYPNYRQQQLIELNDNISRNKLVGIDKELYQLKQTRHHDDYFKLIDYVIKHKEINNEFAQFLVAHHYMSSKTIKKAKAIPMSAMLT